jgi:hypothetical protein
MLTPLADYRLDLARSGESNSIRIDIALGPDFYQTDASFQ